MENEPSAPVSAVELAQAPAMAPPPQIEALPESAPLEAPNVAPILATEPAPFFTTLPVAPKRSVRPVLIGVIIVLVLLGVGALVLA